MSEPVPHAEKASAPEILRLTAVAKEAAEEGRWDLVETYYSCREGLLSLAALSSWERDEIARLDREIMRRIELAQSALIPVIQESSRMRERLEGLLRGCGVPATASGANLWQA